MIKLTKKKKEEYYADFLEHNRLAKRENRKYAMYSSFDEYVLNRFGKAARGKKITFTEYKPTKFDRRESNADLSPSLLDNKSCCTARNEVKKYSGDYIIGIATLHKSNAVPVGREDNPESYAKMRRG